MRQIWVLLSWLVVLVAGCGRSNDTHPGSLDLNFPAQTTEMPALPVDGFINPAEIIARRGSVMSTLFREGDECISHSSNTTLFPGYCTSFKQDGERSWSLYRFDDLVDEDAPTSITVNLWPTEPSWTAKLYVAWSDYGSGTWRWTQFPTPAVDSEVVLPVPADCISLGGAAYVLVGSFDYGICEIEGVSLHLDTAAPVPTDLQASDGTSSSRIELSWSAPQGATPEKYIIERSFASATGSFEHLHTVDGSANEYTDLDGPENDLPFNVPIFYRVRADYGERTSPPSVVNSGSLNYVWEAGITLDSSGDVGAYTSTAVLNDKLCVAYYDTTNHQVKFLQSSDPLGSAWNPAVVVASTGSGLPASAVSLCIVQDKPAIAYFNETDGDLMYTTAQDAAGSTWNPPVTVDAAGTVGTSRKRLYIINGHPAISYFDQINNALKYVRSSTASGATPADWAGAITVLIEQGAYENDLCEVNGQPAICFYDASQNALMYVRAATVNGTDPADWSGIVMVDDGGVVNGGGKGCVLAMIAGNPAIGYQVSNAGQSVRFVRSGDASGSIWAPLTDHVLTVGDSPFIAEVADRPAIAFFQRNNGDKILRYLHSGNEAGDLDGWSMSAGADVDVAATEFSAIQLVVRSDGLPSIFYYDKDLGDLKYAVYH